MDPITKSLQIYLKDADISFFTNEELEVNVTYINGMSIHFNKTDIFMIEVNPKLQSVKFAFQPYILFGKNSFSKIQELKLTWNTSRRFMTLSINNEKFGDFDELYDVQFSFKILCDCTGLTRLLWKRYFDVLRREINVALRHLNKIENIMTDSSDYFFPSI